MDNALASTLTRILRNARAVRMPGDRGVSPGAVINGRRQVPVVSDSPAFERYRGEVCRAAEAAIAEAGFSGVSVSTDPERFMIVAIVTDSDGEYTVEVGL